MSKKLIGEGLQFRVYRLNKKRVLKIPTTHAQKLATLKNWNFRRTALAREAFTKGTVRTLDASFKELKKILPQVDPTLIGNPKFLKHSSYEQDYVKPLSVYLQSHSLSENKRIIEAYVESIIQTWRFGFGDTIFNFTINSGVVRGKVVLLDLGELTFSKNKIRAQVKNKYWLKQYSYTSMTGRALKAHVKKVMNKRITVQALNKYWKSSLSVAEKKN